MPTYEYACKKCKNIFEVFQSMTARPVKECPKCRSKSVKRLIGAGAGFIFKGAGFYATDYRKGNPKPESCPAAKGGTPPDCSKCQAKN